MGIQDGLGDVSCGAVMGSRGKLDFSFDFDDELTDRNGNVVDTVVTHDWEIQPDSATLVGKFQVGNTVGISVEQPQRATAHRLTVLATTNAGRVLEHSWVIGSQEHVRT